MIVIEFPSAIDRGDDKLGYKIGDTPFGTLWVLRDGSYGFYDAKGHVLHTVATLDVERMDRTLLDAKILQRKVLDKLHGRTVVQAVRVEGPLVVAKYMHHVIALARQGTIKPASCLVCKTEIPKGVERYVERPYMGEWRHFPRCSWCLACVPAIPRAKGVREVGT